MIFRYGLCVSMCFLLMACATPPEVPELENNQENTVNEKEEEVVPAGKLLNDDDGIIFERTETYEIQATLPQTEFGFVNNDTKRFVESTVKNVKGVFERNINATERGLFTLNYRIIPFYETQKLSIVYELYTLTSGKKGVTNIHTQLYDLELKRPLFLKDIFKGETQYLQFLQEKITEKALSLSGAYEKDVIASRVTPEFTTFDNFSLTKNGMTFYFEPEILAPLEYGMQTVSITYSELEGFIK